MCNYLTIIHKGRKALGLCKKLTLLLYLVGQLYHYVNQTSLKTKSLTQLTNHLSHISFYIAHVTTSRNPMCRLKNLTVI